MELPTITDTEGKIIEAAKRVFIEKGLESTSMQDIADEAHISRTSIHYYYHNKEMLFEAIFDGVLQEFVPQLHSILRSNCSIIEKIEQLVDNYTYMLQNNSLLPRFMIVEVQRDPKHVLSLLAKKVNEQIDISEVVYQLDNEIKAGRIRPIDFPHLLIMFYSLCVFPFLAQPLFNEMYAFDNEKSFQFIEKQKDISKELIRKFLMP
jgi:TetR/AcrR family transcriptional regulator